MRIRFSNRMRIFISTAGESANAFSGCCLFPSLYFTVSFAEEEFVLP